MKKLFYIVCVGLGLCTIIGCHNPKATNAESEMNDTIQVADTLEMADTLALDSMVCPD